MAEPRILDDAEVEEVVATRGCSFGEGVRPYYIADLIYSLRTARQALRAVALSGTDDVPLWAWCDEGWTCTHNECVQGRYALTGVRR